MLQYRLYGGQPLPPNLEGFVKAGANIGSVIGQFAFGTSTLPLLCPPCLVLRLWRAACTRAEGSPQKIVGPFGTSTACILRRQMPFKLIIHAMDYLRPLWPSQKVWLPSPLIRLGMRHEAVYPSPPDRPEGRQTDPMRNNSDGDSVRSTFQRNIFMQRLPAAFDAVAGPAPTLSGGGAESAESAWHGGLLTSTFHIA